MRRGSIFACAVLFLALAGCARDRSVKSAAKPPYDGPTETIAEVFRQINERNARIKTLRCEGDFRALINTGGKSDSIDGTVTLLYRQNTDLRLVGQVLTERAFDIGSNAERYWLAIPRQDTMWWGYHRLVGGVGAKRLPVRPDLVRQVLEVGPIDTDLLHEPTPVLRFNNDQDCYMITWQVQLSDRWVVQKEVWYDRTTKRPRLVLFFDEGGRVVVRAYLKNFQSIAGDFSADGGGEMASNFDMLFPETGSRFSIDLKELASRRGAVPGQRSFDFPGDRAGVQKVIGVDE